MGQANIRKQIISLEIFKRLSSTKLTWTIFEYLDQYLKSSKSYLIVKEKYLENAVEPVRGSEVKNKKQGKRLLGAVIGNETYKKSYTRLLVDEWFERLELFSKVAESGPQSAYSAFVRGFTGKLIFFVRKILNLRRCHTIVVRNIHDSNK